VTPGHTNLHKSLPSGAGSRKVYPSRRARAASGAAARSATSVPIVSFFSGASLALKIPRADDRGAQSNFGFRPFSPTLVA